MKEPILVSACLLGKACRYDGAAKEDERAKALLMRYELIPVCPEVLGGLDTPRDRAERRGASIVTCRGADVTRAYERGARETLRIAKERGVKIAVLKAKSPSCGEGLIYDGSFLGKLVPGDGAATELLKANGIKVYSEETIDKIKRFSRLSASRPRDTGAIRPQRTPRP